MCHTLRAARVTGLVGPDLDAVRPSEARVRRAIRNGSIDGVMQPGLLRGEDARSVAAYVARAARG
jgi:mono/diheme cytochrome c family protein